MTLETERTPSDQTTIQRQIDATDQQIDQLVYELYGLTNEEIKIVEEATQGKERQRRKAMLSTENTDVHRKGERRDWEIECKA